MLDMQTAATSLVRRAFFSLFIATKLWFVFGTRSLSEGLLLRTGLTNMQNLSKRIIKARMAFTCAKARSVLPSTNHIFIAFLLVRSPQRSPEILNENKFRNCVILLLIKHSPPSWSINRSPYRFLSWETWKLHQLFSRDSIARRLIPLASVLASYYKMKTTEASKIIESEGNYNRFWFCFLISKSRPPSRFNSIKSAVYLFTDESNSQPKNNFVIFHSPAREKKTLRFP